MKKKIIVPVDFSTTSLNAYVYARSLARIYDARIEVVHTYSGSFNPKDPLIIKSGKSTKEVMKERLDDFVKLYPKESDEEEGKKIPVTTRLMQGFAVKSIINISKEKQITMIVMGATGESDRIGKFTGTVSSEVAQKAYCPVLLVPKHVKYGIYKNILYASNYESVQQRTLEQIIDFNKVYDATLHFIHFNTKNTDQQYKAIENQIFEKIFEKGDPEFAFNIASVKTSSVLKGLFDYADEAKIDLIVIVNREIGFFESLFGMSLTKKIALRTHVPILAYHA